MDLAIPYMGTKKDLAPAVANIICGAKPGIVLDAFSGMCAIGQAVGARRQVWNNDVQSFAAHVAGALFTSRRALKPQQTLICDLLECFSENQAALRARFARRLSAERAALAAGSVRSISGYLAGARHVGSSNALERERSRLQTAPTEFPYRLCAITYADGYFSLQQSIDIDSARWSLDQALTKNIIDDDEFRWLLIALCHAAVKIATTTGHFAQFLKVNGNNSAAYVKQRQRSLWSVWTEAFSGGLHMLGSAVWRRRNKAFNSESLALLGLLGANRIRPAVVYADPPYTDDQYSRYYHVWETLIRYDYPSIQGEGRYRPDRFYTPFSRKSEVAWAFRELIKRSAALGADLVLSYPDTGLLQEAGCDLTELLSSEYENVSLAIEVPHHHSTMGASKGAAKSAVTERVYLASN